MAARSVLSELARALGRRDEAPNQELAVRLARTKNRAGIRELAAHLQDTDPHIPADAIKVLCEVGHLNPELIADHVPDFLALLNHRNNRLVWGGMTALSTVAALRPDEIFKQVGKVEAVTRAGSVITQDAGIKALAEVAAHSERYGARIRPFLLQHLRECRAKDVPQRSEKALVAFRGAAARDLVTLLTERLPQFTAPQAARVRKVLKLAEARP